MFVYIHKQYLGQAVSTRALFSILKTFLDILIKITPKSFGVSNPPNDGSTFYV